MNKLAAEGFQRGAADYERGRPGYPGDAVRLLIERLGITAGSLVVDLGAGTGKLTHLLEPSGAVLVAVEPVAAMRSAIPDAVPRSVALGGTAERIPLREGAADALVVAQAFHWFEPENALDEIARVLRPGGGLGIAYNIRDDAAGWPKRMTEIIAPYRDAVLAKGALASSAQMAASQGMLTGPWRVMLEADSRFTPLQEELFRYEQSLTLEGVLDRTSSISFIAMLDEADRQTALDRMRELIATHPDTAGRERVELPYVTHVLWCTRR